MPYAAYELVILGFLIVANGLMTAAETAFVSAKKVKLLRMAESGSEGAGAALVIAEHPGRFLGLVQFWLTLTCVIAGVALVSSAAEGFASWFAHWPAVAPWAETFGLVSGTLIISAAMLLFGELLPKRIVLANPERAAAILGRAMRMFSKVVSPCSALLGLASEAIAGDLTAAADRIATRHGVVGACLSGTAAVVVAGVVWTSLESGPCNIFT